MRQLYYTKRFYKLRSDSKKMWSNINNIRKWKSHSGVNYVKNDNGDKINHNDLPTYFNDYFTGVVLELIRNLPVNIDFNFFNRIPTNCSSCFLLPTNLLEVDNLISELPDKGNCLYDIKPCLLKKIKNYIGPFLVHIYNLCVSKGVYPDALKRGRVVPIFKSGDRHAVSNYRPITNLSPFNKIFEILTHKRLTDYIEHFKILNERQFGFRKGCNTTQAIFTLFNYILPSFNEKNFTIALFLDLKKAFDLVNFDILIHKLSLYGMRGLTNSFISSYLNNRTQFVDLNGLSSGINQVVSGVPQGSVLGPLFFNIFINDIFSINNAKKVLFADDAVFCVSDITFDGCIDKVKQLIIELELWLDKNKLIANAVKTKLILFTPCSINVFPNIFFKETLLQWTDTIQYLGLTIDRKLSLNNHAAEVCKKLNKVLGLIYSVSSFLPQNVLLLIYKSIALPTLTQNVIIWGNISANSLKNIIITQNKILRCILHVQFDENHIPLMPVNHMYSSLNLLKFTDLVMLSMIKYLHKILYENNTIFETYFFHLLPVHNYTTRNRRINLPPIRLQVEKQFTVFQLCKIYIELSEDLLAAQSKKSLTKKFMSLKMSSYLS